jgi:ubiquinone/menaquinone biosynthesis C-methylase UbiE
MASCGAEIHLADLTHAMLAEGRLDIVGHGLEFRAAVALNGRLPFPTATFDVLTCTRAYHHVSDIRGALLEARRVLKPFGRLLATDHSGPDVLEAMDFVNKVSRLRDRSHADALSPSEWRNLLADVGFDLRQIQHVELRQELDTLFEAAGDAATRIEGLFGKASSSVLDAIECDGSAPAGFTSVIVVFDAVSAG